MHVHAEEQDHHPSLPTLADAAAIEALRASDPGFAEFLGEARRGSGLEPASLDPQRACYRVVLAQGSVNYDLHYDGRIGNSVASASLQELLAATLSQPRDALIHAVWSTGDLAELKRLFLALRATVRYRINSKGELHGHMVLARALIALVEMLEAGQTSLSNGEPVLDSITRNLGIRNKVQQLLSAPKRQGDAAVDNSHQNLQTLIRRWQA